MSQASSIFRANSNSGYFSSVKSRKSAGVSGCNLLYNREINSCSECVSRVESFGTSANYNSLCVIELPNFGHLSEAFLKITFAKSDGAGASNRSGLSESGAIHLCQTIKLISDGVEIARTTPQAMLCHYYKNASNQKRRMYQQLTGGFKNRSIKTAFPSNANKDSVIFPEARALADKQTFYLPLNFWFSALEEQQNRAIPLGVLERVFIEVQTADAGYVGYALGTSTHLNLDSISVISYLTELDPAEEAMYRNSSFSTSDPLSILAKNYVQHIERGISHSAGTDTNYNVKLNMITGSISKLYVVCHDEASSAQKDAAGVDLPTKCHFVPEIIKSIKLNANGVELVKLENLCENEKYLNDWLAGNYTTCNPMGTASKANHMAGDAEMGASWSSVVVDTTTDGDTATNWNASTITSLNTSMIDPASIYVVSFKSVAGDQRDSSMNGSINFSNLSTPSLDVVINGTSDNNYGGRNGATGKKSIIVIAVQHNLISYSTNNAGRVSLRSVS